MASIANDPGGRRRIVFKLPSGQRKAIRLGKVSAKQAETIRFHVEHLVSAALLGTAPPDETSRWLAGRPAGMTDKLAAAGLIARPAPVEVTRLKPFLTAHVDGRADLKPATKIIRRQVISDVATYFGESRDVRTITAGDADDFKQWLIARKLAATTIHKRLQVARSFFHAMTRRKLIDENPFDGVKAAASGIKDRQRFVTRLETDKLLDACPDHHWRTIVALSRYGGLRCPSEVLSLRWDDVDWANDRIVVQSPKTEHYAEKATRSIPLFAELRKTLLEAAELAPEGAVYVVHERFRKGAQGPGGWINANLRTTFEKIIKRAGLTPWPRIFHNLRASRETELVERYPIQVVTNWLGNSPTVAMRHYLMTTDEHFRAAVQGDEPTYPKVAQKAAQQTPEDSTLGPKVTLARDHQTANFRGFSGDCRNMLPPKVAEEGFEPPTRGL